MCSPSMLLSRAVLPGPQSIVLLEGDLEVFDVCVCSCCWGEVRGARLISHTAGASLRLQSQLRRQFSLHDRDDDQWPSPTA